MGYRLGAPAQGGQLIGQADPGVGPIRPYRHSLMKRLDRLRAQPLRHQCAAQSIMGAGIGRRAGDGVAIGSGRLDMHPALKQGRSQIGMIVGD